MKKKKVINFKWKEKDSQRKVTIYINGLKLRVMIYGCRCVYVLYRDHFVLARYRKILVVRAVNIFKTFECNLIF